MYIKLSFFFKRQISAKSCLRNKMSILQLSCLHLCKNFFFCYFTVVPMTLLMDLNEVKWLVIIFSLIDLIFIFYVCLPVQTKRGYFWDWNWHPWRSSSQTSFLRAKNLLLENSSHWEGRSDNGRAASVGSVSAHLTSFVFLPQQRHVVTRAQLFKALLA